MKFLITGISENTNSFGLRGVRVLDEYGECHQMGLNYLNVKNLETWDILEAADLETLTSTLNGEIPETFSTPPVEIIQLWKENAETDEAVEFLQRILTNKNSTQ